MRTSQNIKIVPAVGDFEKFYGADSEWVKANLGQTIEVIKKNMNYYLAIDEVKLIHVYNAFVLNGK